ncbi:MAG: hypothetical protein FWH53_00750 [Leptospirales bacterium]|nr:hypothetical protein [Leptospirales bacterium]
MKIGIVGARDFAQLDLVESFIKQLPQGITIISGGAKGVDTAAKIFGELYAHTVLEYLPNLQGCKERYEFTHRYYDRNQRIAEDCDLLVAFTDKEQGGTWDTIKRARKLGKPVKIIKSTLFFVGRESEPNDMDLETNNPTRKTDCFHLKRVTLGSFALNLKRYKDPIFLADLVQLKESAPEKFADIVMPDFLRFFKKYKTHIDIFTPAQRSKRNIEKEHPVDIICERLSTALNIPTRNLFEPWDKRARGIKECDAKVEIKTEALSYIGKVVYVIDDVVTTGYTMKQACSTLTNLGIHTHGIAYILWS